MVFRKLIGALVGLALFLMGGSANALFLSSGQTAIGAFDWTGNINFPNAVNNAVLMTFSGPDLLDAGDAFTVSTLDSSMVTFGSTSINLPGTFIGSVPSFFPVTGNVAPPLMGFISFEMVSGSLDLTQLSAAFQVPAGVGSFTIGGQQVVNLAIVPEPSTLAIFALGLAGLGFMGWRRNPRRSLAR